MKNKLPKPTFKKERIFWKKKYLYIAGVDEVGRGSFAGPVVAGAVIFSPDFKPDFEINDSKLIPKDKRLEISKKIKKAAICYSTSKVDVKYINKYGIIKATQKAFCLAIKKLKIKPNHILIDAFYIDKIDKNNQTPIIHGDRLSVSIAAASIIAKVYRDNLMVKLNNKYPLYGFGKNKGYGTKFHKEAIKKNGFCKEHRTRFNISKYLRAAGGSNPEPTP